MLVRRASAEWKGDLVNGQGSLQSDSGAVQGQYSFSSRFAEGIGTNPEELLAAAHAGCYAMALSAALAKGGFQPERVEAKDEVCLEKTEAGFSITKIIVHVKAKVNGISVEEFLELAEATKQGCPVSRALAGTTFVLEAELESL